MRPHKPIDIDSFDREFFSKNNSGAVQNDQSPAFTQGAVSSCPVFTSDKVTHPSLTPDVIEGLMNMHPSGNGSVFHDLPEYDAPSQPQQIANIPLRQREALISEEEALKSFPAFVFDPSALEIPENEEPVYYEQPQPPVSRRSELKEYKRQAKHELKEEKNRLNAQKELEFLVQRPFKARRTLVFFMILFILIGSVVTAGFVVLTQTGSTPDTAFEIGDYNLCYVDGENTKSSELNCALVLFEKSKPKSDKKMIIFESDSAFHIETVLAIRTNGNSEVFFVKYAKDSYKAVRSEEAIGVVTFSVNGMEKIYNIAQENTLIIYACIAAYFILTIGLFSLLIHSKNKLIKNYNESYQLVK